MAFPTAVNSQITDSAAPNAATDAAAAIGQIYQSLAQSVGILFENAVSAQQQMQVSAQAATNQGVVQIYSVDTAADAVGTRKILQSDAPDTLASTLAAMRATQANTLSAVALPTPDPHADAHAHGAAVAHAVREAAAALQAAIAATQQSLQIAHAQVLHNAALAATLAAMVRHPERADAYASLLKTIAEHG